MHQANEAWKPVAGFEGLYQISNTGKIRREKNDRLRNRYPALREMTPRLDYQGYLQITLCHLGTRKTIKMHRAIAEAFIPNPLTKATINHKNGNKADNRIENLEWMSAPDNARHYWQVLRKQPRLTAAATIPRMP